MPVIGMSHEFSFYGVLAALYCLLTHKTTITSMKYYAFHPQWFTGLFQAYLFWSCILFIPIAIVGAFETKYLDSGKGLTFDSDNILVIIFAHIAEDILALFLSVFWFLKDFFSGNLDAQKIASHVIAFSMILFILIGIVML